MLIDKVNIPDRTLGSAKIERFVVPKDVMSIIRYGSRAPLPGTYTKLTINGRLMMTDTPAEMRDHYGAVRSARGNVLVTGLGLGMVANAIAAKPEVDSITVVELNADVIGLVEPTLHPKVSVVHGDAFAFVPPKDVRYGAVWHDIWPDLCTDNLAEMTRLKRRFARRADWQGCWGEELLRARKRREDREERRWSAFR